MRLLYLNTVFMDALKGEGLELKDEDSLQSFLESLSYPSQNVILTDTEVLLRTSGFKPYEFEHYFKSYRDTFYNSGLLNDLDPVVLDSMRREILSELPNTHCLALSADTIVLYVEPEPAPKRSAIERVFMALSSKIPVDDVMKTRQFGIYAS